MKSVITIFFCLFSLLSFGQTNEENNETVMFSRIGELTDKQLNNSGPPKLRFVTDIKEAQKLAELDIKNGNPFLLIMGGIAPTVIATDPEFERKYQIYFYQYGCSGPESEIMRAYNEVIFTYLTKQNGRRWEKEVRDDVFGFKNRRKK